MMKTRVADFTLSSEVGGSISHEEEGSWLRHLLNGDRRMPTALSSDDHAFVVPAYGNSPFLGACLRSLRGQSAPSPVVVATSTPSEALSAVAAAFDAPVLVNPRREGIAADWNFAFEGTPAQY